MCVTVMITSLFNFTKVLMDNSNSQKYHAFFSNISKLLKSYHPQNTSNKQNTNILCTSPVHHL